MQHTVTPLFGGATPEPFPARARVIAVTSGKGGVGKTSVTANLAIALARQGKRVCIFDADTGLANINILLGLNPRHTLQDFVQSGMPLDEILMTGPRGVAIVPGASGIAEFADLEPASRQALLNGLQQLESRFDYVLIDTAAGIADAVISFVLAAGQVLLVVSPDPTSLTDAFALTRVLKRRGREGRIHVLVNMADSAEAARKVYQRFAQAVDKYLQVPLDWIGSVPADRAMVAAIRLQHPVVLMQPESPAGQGFEQLAMRIRELPREGGEAGIAAYLRSQAAAAPDPATAAIELIRNAQPTPRPLVVASGSAPSFAPQEADLGALNRQIVDCIQDSKATAREMVAAIKPIIDAYVARFHAFPLDMREAVYRHLELADIPEHEIREQVVLLESLYEKRYQRPLLDKEDNLFRLLNQVRHSEPEFAAAITRLQHTYERQYRPPARDAVAALLERLRQSDATEDDFAHGIDALRALYAERFGRAYAVDDAALRTAVTSLVEEALLREAARHDALLAINAELGRSDDYQQRLQAVLDSLEAR